MSRSGWAAEGEEAALERVRVRRWFFDLRARLGAEAPTEMLALFINTIITRIIAISKS